MKKVVVLTAVLLVFLLSAMMVEAPIISNFPQLEFTLLSQSPDPVEPGQVVKLRFQVANSGPVSDDDVIVKLKPQYPFSLYEGSEERNIGKVRSGSDTVVVEYDVKIDEDAVEKETQIELEVRMGTNVRVYNNEEFLVDIQTHDAVLDIVSIDAKQIPPGQPGEITFVVKNLADSLLKDIRFKLDFSDETLPLAPYQSSSERILNQLKSGFQDALTFNIIADPEATPGLYKVPLTIKFNDERGENTTITDVLAVQVGEIPKLRAHIKRSTVMQSSKEGTVTLEIANAGTTDVKLLELWLLLSEDYQLITPTDYFYIGDIDADDTESEDISIYVNGGVDTLHIPLRLQYYDANNKPIQQDFDLELELFSSYKLRKYGVIEGSSIFSYLFIIILGAGGYYLYRRYYKPRKQKKAS
ncbi:hypothetical protein COV20_05810 [Candidatus Woesearchaeota archaeon CG10_big_fil_rev_8_21_14_0_10_45_16]|nr:MAG: hypothetical protein COV20_05810 [Candidatus Woesearchaeota archaeon CG10_big_fil_rev_8_21_14_0_10_45_16]